MKNIVYRKCRECGTMNKNTDYCTNCGALVNILKRRRQERERQEERRREKEENQRPNALTLWYEKGKVHNNPIIRFIANFFYSIWVVVLLMGAILALIITYIVA